MLRKTRKKKDMKPGAFLLLLIMPLVISAALACQNREARDSGRARASTPATQNKIAPAERWLGKWNGPEGTFLEISQISQGYQITIQNLDGPRTFPAEPEAEGLQ